jgi:hypothetical protein
VAAVKPKRPSPKYLARARAFAEAVDIGVELRAAKGEGSDGTQELLWKEQALTPEPLFANLRSLAYLEDAFFTYWNEASGEHIERFWQRVRERGLPFQRRDVVGEILSRGRINKPDGHRLDRDPAADWKNIAGRGGHAEQHARPVREAFGGATKAGQGRALERDDFSPNRHPALGGQAGRFPAADLAAAKAPNFALDRPTDCCAGTAGWSEASPLVAVLFATEVSMATRQELVEHLWKEVINVCSADQALDNIVTNCKRDRDGPFGDTGPAIERLLAAGSSRRDLRLVLRHAAYEAVFGTLYALSDPGLDEHDSIGTLYEELLMADPSGTEGRPGSADTV